MARDIGKTDAYVVSRRQRKKVEMLFARPAPTRNALSVRQASGMTDTGAKGWKTTVRFGRLARLRKHSRPQV